MKRISAGLAIMIMLSSCPVESYDFVNLLALRDRTPPTLSGYTLMENRMVSLKFDEIVSIREALLENEDVSRPSKEASSLTLQFRSALEAGEEKTLFLTCEDRSGNTSRYAIKLTGINLNQADLLITEVSVKGTEASPDRIELTATKSGSVLGYALLDGIIGYEKHRYFLPDLYLYRNDIIVIYWDRCQSLPETLQRDSERTYYLFAESPETLISTNGAIVLYNHTNGKGKVEDALLYNSSDAENSNGYGNKASEESAKYLMSIEEWSGKSFSSDQITSSRVAARYYPYDDSNSKDDFYTTAARNSTFGYPNTNVIYEP